MTARRRRPSSFVDLPLGDDLDIEHAQTTEPLAEGPLPASAEEAFADEPLLSPPKVFSSPATRPSSAPDDFERPLRAAEPVQPPTSNPPAEPYPQEAAPVAPLWQQLQAEQDSGELPDAAFQPWDDLADPVRPSEPSAWPDADDMTTGRGFGAPTGEVAHPRQGAHALPPAEDLGDPDGLWDDEDPLPPARAPLADQPSFSIQAEADEPRAPSLRTSPQPPPPVERPAPEAQAQPRRRRRWLPWVIGAIVLALISAALTQGGGQAETQPTSTNTTTTPGPTTSTPSTTSTVPVAPAPTTSTPSTSTPTADTTAPRVGRLEVCQLDGASCTPRRLVAPRSQVRVTASLRGAVGLPIQAKLVVNGIAVRSFDSEMEEKTTQASIVLDEEATAERGSYQLAWTVGDSLPRTARFRVGRLRQRASEEPTAPQRNRRQRDGERTSQQERTERQPSTSGRQRRERQQSESQQSERQQAERQRPSAERPEPRQTSQQQSSDERQTERQQPERARPRPGGEFAN